MVEGEGRVNVGGGDIYRGKGGGWGLNGMGGG